MVPEYSTARYAWVGVYITEWVGSQLRQLGYKIGVHIAGDQTFIVGALDNAERAETVLWQVADAIVSPDNKTGEI